MSEARRNLQVKFKRWGEAGAGKVEVDSAQVRFYRGRLFRQPELKLTIDWRKLLHCDVSDAGKERTVTVSYESGGANPASERVTIMDATEADKLRQAVQRFLDEIETERRAKGEEEARRKREEEEKAEGLRRDYVAGVWAAADVLWEAAAGVYSLVDAARSGEWADAREAYTSLWQLDERLKERCGIDGSAPLSELGLDLAAQDGEAALKRCASLLDLISLCCSDPMPVAEEWKKLDALKEGISPNWLYLGYFLLFSLSFNESRLCLETGDWAGLERSLNNLTAASVVVSRKFGITTEDTALGLRAAAEGKDMAAYEGTADRLRQSVAVYLAEHRLREKDSGKNNAVP